MPKPPSVKVGDKFKINNGGIVEVIKYNRFNDVLIKHLDDHGYISSVHVHNLKRGCVRNPYFPAYYGVGYLGVGEYKVFVGNKHTPAYAAWHMMMHRVYSEEVHKIEPTYAECSVCSDWHDFQNFAEWYYKEPNSQTRGFQLDKDLMVLGNKVYGPTFCSFIPQEVNSLLNASDRSRGDLPQGVVKDGRMFKARLGKGKTRVHLGNYPTEQQAFEVYKKAKEEYVKEVANRNKDVLHPKVYENLMNWEL